MPDFIFCTHERGRKNSDCPMNFRIFLINKLLAGRMRGTISCDLYRLETALSPLMAAVNYESTSDFCQGSEEFDYHLFLVKEYKS